MHEPSSWRLRSIGIVTPAGLLSVYSISLIALQLQVPKTATFAEALHEIGQRVGAIGQTWQGWAGWLMAVLVVTSVYVLGSIATAKPVTSADWWLPWTAFPYRVVFKSTLQELIRTGDLDQSTNDAFLARCISTSSNERTLDNAFLDNVSKSELQGKFNQMKLATFDSKPNAAAYVYEFEASARCFGALFQASAFFMILFLGAGAFRSYHSQDLTWLAPAAFLVLLCLYSSKTVRYKRGLEVWHVVLNYVNACKSRPKTDSKWRDEAFPH